MHIKNKFPPKLTTLEFLTSSHFKIGMEPKWLCRNDPLAYKSTIKQDYPPKFKKKTELAEMPPSAAIMHKDDAIHDQCSVTHKEFTKKDNIQKSNPCQSLTKTNFKMDIDDRIKSFETTQRSCYRSDGVIRKKDINCVEVANNHLKSYIPQGDLDKERLPETEHKSQFYARHLTKRRQPIYNLHDKTIQGDIRCHGGNIFDTTCNQTFPPYKCNPKLKISDEIKYPKSQIKICGEETLPYYTTQRSSFGWKSPSSGVPFNKGLALENLRKTSFQNGDQRWNYFQTTNQRYLTPKVLSDTDRKKKKLSFLGAGKFTQPSVDMTSSTRSHYQAPPERYRNEIVDGSNFHTVSVICFGTGKPSWSTTTTRDSFRPKKSNYQKLEFTGSTKSSIPLDYYRDLVSDTSYRTDYVSGKLHDKWVVNQKALADLMATHIGDPVQGMREFSTTNGDIFTPKRLSRPKHIDIGRLQKSNVPLGTIYD